MALFQVLMQNPFVDQQELTKYMLEEVKPDLVERLFMSPEKLMMRQMMEQAQMGGMAPMAQMPVAPPQLPPPAPTAPPAANPATLAA